MTRTLRAPAFRACPASRSDGNQISPARICRRRDCGQCSSMASSAAPLPMTNVDTDMIIPKQYLKTINRTGLGRGLFDEMRYDDNGDEIADFVLNKPAYRGARLLVTGENFGCGSSREHAPWALLDFGIRCVIAPSFADIFYNNCFKNGILPVALPQAQVDKLMDDAERGANATLTVDLEAQTIRGPDGGATPGTPGFRFRDWIERGHPEFGRPTTATCIGRVQLGVVSAPPTRSSPSTSTRTPWRTSARTPGGTASPKTSFTLG